MACQLSHQTQKQEGGISPDKWYEAWLKNKPFENGNTKTMVDARDADGKIVQVPLGKCGIVFYNWNLFKEERTSGVRSNTPLVIADSHPELVVLETGLPATDKLGKYKLIDGIRSKDENANPLVLPLGFISLNKKSEFAKAHYVVLMDLACRWLTKNKRGIEADEHHVCNMFLSALQSLAWEISNETDSDVTKKKTQNFLLLAQATKQWFTYAQQAYEEVVKPLKQLDYSIDSLQKTIALMFDPEPITFEEQLRLVETMLKRNSKYAKAKPDFITQPIFGIYITLLLIPKAQVFIQENKGSAVDSEASLRIIEDLNSELLELVKDMSQGKLHKLSKDDSNIKILTRLFSYCPLLTHLTKLQVGKFYNYCKDLSNQRKLAPYQEWGWIQPVSSKAIPVQVTGFKYHGKSLPTCKIVYKSDSKKTLVTSPDFTNFAAISFIENGLYQIKSELCAKGEIVTGDSRGKPRAAIVRLTTGNDIFPTDIDGISSAGKVYQLTETGKFEFLDFPPFNPTIPFYLEILDSGFKIFLGKVKSPYYTQEKKKGELVTLAFKYFQITVEKLPLSSQEWTIEKLKASKMTAISLMKELQDIAIQEEDDDMSK